MFIVYSPEGQNVVGSVQQLPLVRVDPTKRVNKINESEFEKLNVDERQKAPHSNQQAISAYENNKKQPRKLVVKLAELMSAPVVTTPADLDIEAAWNLMQKHTIKHLPVLDNARLVGMLSQKDLLKRVIVDKAGELEGVVPEKVADIMNASVVTTQASTDIRHAAQALTNYEIDVLLVMDDFQNIQGIVTQGDLIKRLANEPPLELYT